MAGPTDNLPRFPGAGVSNAPLPGDDAVQASLRAMAAAANAAPARAAAATAAQNPPVNGIPGETAPGPSPFAGLPAYLSGNASRVAAGFAVPAPTPAAVAPTNAVPFPAPTNFGGTPPAPVVAPATTPAVAATVADNAVPLPTDGGVSATPGAGNPLPPSLRGATAAGVPPLPGLPASTIAGTAPAGGAVFNRGAPSYSGGGGAAPGPNQMGDNDLEVIRGNQSQVYSGFNGPAGGVSAGGANGSGGAGGSGLFDPSAMIQGGFNAQEDRGQRLLNTALSYIQGGNGMFEQASRARQLAPIFAASFGPNNQGAVTGAGGDSLLGAVSGVQQAGISADAAMTDTAANNASAQAVENTRVSGAKQVARITKPAQLVEGPTTYVDNGMGLRVPTNSRFLNTTGEDGSQVTQQVTPRGVLPTALQALPTLRQSNPAMSDTELLNNYRKSHPGS